MKSRIVMRMVVVRLLAMACLACCVQTWMATSCLAIGLRGGGGMPHGSAMMGGGRGPGLPGGIGPSMGGLAGPRPAAMPRPNLPLGGPGGLDHGAIPGFPNVAGPAARPGGGVTPSQLGSFLGLPGGGSPAGAGANIPRPPAPLSPNAPRNLGPGPAWPAGHAGNRPSWSGPSPGSAGNVAARVQDALRPGAPNAAQLHNWLDNNPQRAQQLQDRGDQIRQRWQDGDHPPIDHGSLPGSDWWSKYHPNWKDHGPGDRGVIPGSDWWSKYHPNLDNWYYHHDWHHHGWAYWWRTPTWVAVGAWFPAWGWTDPVYYDYGEGGNVVYQNQNVYVNGQEVGSAAEYAQSAADLATVSTDQAQATSDDEDWMPLGTFAVVTSEKDTSPSRVLQLAVDRQGIISGTMHNSSTNQTYVVQGRVDKDTQRVAFTFGDKSDIIMETGIYNLTQPQTPVLIHFGTDHTEHYVLVRLDLPSTVEGSKGEDDAATSSEKPFGT